MKQHREKMLVLAIAAVLIAVASVYGTSAQSAGKAEAGSTRAPASAKAPVTGTCKSPKTVESVSDNDNQSTTATTFVDIPGMTLTTTVKAGCVVITFSNRLAYTFGGPDGADIRAVMDGSTYASPGGASGVQLVTSPNDYGAVRSVTWLFSGVPKGTHTFKLQFRSFNAGAVLVNQSLMLIAHA